MASLLRDMSEAVRLAAAKSLERLEGIAGLNEILELLKKGSYPEKVKAIYALGEIGEERVLPALIYCASRPEEGVRAAAIEALGTLAHPSARQVLMDRLGDQEPLMRSKAIAALANYRDPSLAPHLIPFLDADDGMVEVEALRALAAIGDRSIEDKVMKLLRSSYPATREAAAWALGQLPLM